MHSLDPKAWRCCPVWASEPLLPSRGACPALGSMCSLVLRPFPHLGCLSCCGCALTHNVQLVCTTCKMEQAWRVPQEGLPLGPHPAISCLGHVALGEEGAWAWRCLLLPWEMLVPLYGAVSTEGQGGEGAFLGGWQDLGFGLWLLALLAGCFLSSWQGWRGVSHPD